MDELIFRFNRFKQMSEYYSTDDSINWMDLNLKGSNEV